MNPPVPVQHTQKPISFNPKLTADQEAALESQFSRAKTLHATDLEILAAEMGVDDKDVKVRRKKWPRSGSSTLCDVMRLMSIRDE